MWNCKHCNSQFEFNSTSEKANHSRWCEANPKLANFKLSNSIKGANQANKKYGFKKEFTVKCKCCNKNFIVLEREKLFPKKEIYFCSRICANSVGGKAKAKKYHYDEVATYTTIAWRYHEKKCVACGEDKIVAVHHLNEIHSDNDPKNLIPLCPTHHQYVHSRYKYLVEDKINTYLKEKWG
jgi:hypothetical protein